MKKFIVALLVSAMAASLVACGGTPKEQTSKESTAGTPPTEKVESVPGPVAEETTNGVIDIKGKDGNLKYIKHELTTDYEGKPVILIYFDFTNNKEESAMAQLSFDTKPFQNGVECEFAIVTERNEQMDNLLKEVQTGTTIQVAESYVLQDDQNPVSLEVKEMFDFNAKPQKQELALK